MFINGIHYRDHSCINICSVPRKLFEQEAAGRVLKHLPRDPVNITVMQLNKNVWSLFLYFGMTTEKCQRNSLKTIELYAINNDFIPQKLDWHWR